MSIKTILSHLGIALIAGAVVWFFKPAEKPDTVFVPSEIIIKDTCINDTTLLCEITAEDSLSIYHTVREGRRTKSQNIEPKIESTVKVEPETFELEEVRTREIRAGMTTIYDTITFIGRIKEWKTYTKADTLVRIEEKKTNYVAVVEKNGNDSQTIKYIPFEKIVKPRSIGITGDVLYQDKVRPIIGLSFDTDKYGIGIGKEIGTDIREAEGYRIQFNWKLIKLRNQ